MNFFKKTYQVKPNTLGYLFRENKLVEKLIPGYYKLWDWKNRTALISLPTTSKLVSITNQEVLAKDNVAFRFSFNILYKIVDGERLLSKVSLENGPYYIISDVENRIYNLIQIIIRNRLSEIDSETLNEKRNELTDLKSDEILTQALELGIEVEAVTLKDLTFPKSIQYLFSKHLEAKIRAKSELENARTAVAMARALKNAATLIKENEHIKFFQLLETMTKIADKGKHTFMIGDVNPFAKK